MKEEDRGLVEKPEQLMMISEYMEAWQRAVDRQKKREEEAVKEAEDDMAEEEEMDEGDQTEAVSQDGSESQDGEMEMESKNGLSNGQESNTENGHSEMFSCFAFCKGFTNEDCDVEEYFEENHENVEQVKPTLS